MSDMRFSRYIAILAAACVLAAPVSRAADDEPSRAEQRKALRDAEKKAKDELKKAKKAGDEQAIKQAEDELADI